VTSDTARQEPSGEYAGTGEGGEEGERGLGKTMFGAAAGGLLGHKAGHHGMLGAIGGAIAGNMLGKHQEKRHSYGRRDDRRDDDLAYGDDYDRQSHHSTHSHHSHHSGHSSRHSNRDLDYGEEQSYGSGGGQGGYGDSLRPDDGGKQHHRHHSRERGGEGSEYRQ